MMMKVVSGLVCLLLLAVTSTGGCTGSLREDQTAGSGTVPEIRVITENFPPFNTLDKDGVVRGQSTDIVKEIARRQNQNVSVEVLPWAEGYLLLQTEPDVALYSTVRTAERENLFFWVGPIGSIDYILYARNGSAVSIPSLEAAKKGGTIGVVRDDVRHQFLQSENVTNLDLCSDDMECAELLSEGKIDLWLGSSSAADVSRLAGLDPVAFRPVYTMKRTELYIAFSNRTPAGTVAAWQRSLDAMKKDGTYDHILTRYRSGTVTSPSGRTPGQTVSVTDTAFVVSAVIPIVEGRLNAVLRPLEAVAVSEEARSGDWGRIRPLLASVEAKEPSARLWFARPDGTYYTTVDNLTSANLLGRPYFPALLAGNESVGTIVSSHSTGRNVVIVAVPVIDQGTVTGMLGASVSLDSITTEVKDALALPDTLQFFAIDPAGTVALHSENERIFQNEITPGTARDGTAGAAITGMLARNAGTLSYDTGGRHWDGAFETSPLTGWHIAVVSADTV
jgi:ABC-type amino acid transport substrate-binding protein